MANEKVMFKLGTQSALEKLTAAQIQVGTFYLTSDTDRLYVGQESGLKLLNKTVQVVPTLSSLPTNPYKEDFAYIADKNILAVYTGTEWKQINPDTNSYITSIDEVIASETNGASVATTINQTTAGGVPGSVASNKVKILGNTNKSVKVEADTDNDAIKITGDTYTLSSSVATEGSNVNIKTATVKLSSALGQSESAVKVQAGSANVSINAIDGGFTIDSKDTQLKDVSIIGTNDATGVVTIEVTDTANNSKEASINLGYKVGNKFVGITTDGNPVKLDVYTTKEVDDKFKTLNPMRYIGTIGSSGLYTIASGKVVTRQGAVDQPVSSGDMFLVAGTISYGSGTAKQGDLLIASGEENDDGILDTIIWNYVPSGDDVSPDTTYVFEADAAQNSWDVLKDGTDSAGKIQLKAGTAINVSSTADGAGKELTTTITHADVDCAKPAAATQTLSTAAPTFDAVKSIEVNAQGHITKLETERVTTNVYKPGADAINTVENGVKISHTLMENGTTTIENPDAYFNITSTTLNVAQSGDAGVGIELLWGSF